MEIFLNNFSYYSPTVTVYFFPTVLIQNVLHKDFISIIYPWSKPCKSQPSLFCKLKISFLEKSWFTHVVVMIDL